MTWNSSFIPVDMVGLVLTRWARFLTENDGFDPKRPENSFFTLVNMVWPILTRWTRFWLKMMVLTRNSMKLNFLPWSTWFDLYWPGELGFGRKLRFWLETARNSFFTLVDMVWPGGLGFDGKMWLTREKYIFEF